MMINVVELGSPSQKQRRWTAARASKFLMVSFVLLAVLMFSYGRSLINRLDKSCGDRSNYYLSALRSVRQAVPYTNICSSASKLFRNTTELKVAVEANIQFHRNGGNLHSIGKYLDRHMQSTLDRQGVHFTPNTADNKPVPNAIEFLNDYYKKNEVKRGGYGQPLPGKFHLSSDEDGHWDMSTFFEKRWINVLEPSTSERFTAGIGPVGPACSEPIKFSEGTYEEKQICFHSEKKEPKNNDEMTKECNIVSIGSNDQWGFEEEVMNNPILSGCVTHTFDCTLRGAPKKKPQNDNVKFYPYCIGSEGQHPSYLPFDEMLKVAKIKQAPKYLKMDIEGFEYDVILNSILSSDSSLWPEQIMMEVHWGTRMVDLEWMPRTRTAAELSLFFGVLFNRGGYILQRTKSIKGCETCLEVLLVRAVCEN